MIVEIVTLESGQYSKNIVIFFPQNKVSDKVHKTQIYILSKMVPVPDAKLLEFKINFSIQIAQETTFMLGHTSYKPRIPNTII